MLSAKNELKLQQQSTIMLRKQSMQYSKSPRSVQSIEKNYHRPSINEAKAFGQRLGSEALASDYQTSHPYPLSLLGKVTE